MVQLRPLPGFGGGSGDSDSLTERFLTWGGDLRTRKLAGTVIGTLLVSWWVNAMRLLEELWHWATQLLTQPIDRGSLLLETTLSTPGAVMTTSWRSAAAFLGELGLLAWPLGIAITMATLYVADYAIAEVFG